MPNEPTPKADGGQNSAPAPAPDPAVPVKDDDGVSYFNRFKEAERKREILERERDEARSRALEVEGRFDDTLSTLRAHGIGAQPNPQSPQVLGANNQIASGGMVAPNVVQPVTPQVAPTAAPAALTQEEIRQTVAQSFQEQQALAEYNGEKTRAEATAKDRYSDLADPASSFSKQHDYHLANKQRWYQQMGMIPPPGLYLEIANELVTSGNAQVSASPQAQPTPGNASPATPGQIPPPQTPAPLDPVDDGTMPDWFLNSFLKTGMTKESAEAAWKRQAEDPKSASFKYANGIRMNWGAN